MTKTYNRFHDPYEDDSDITKLRELHAAMDRAVLDAYGWTDIPTDCDFLLDYEIDEATWGRKKKPYRYRWPDAVRDEVLARLLALNAGQRPEQAPPAQRFRPLPKPFRAFRNEPLPALRLSRSNILSCQAMYIAYLRSDDVVAWWATMTEPAIRICISTCQGDAGERSTAPEMRLPARAMDDHWTHVGAGCLR